MNILVIGPNLLTHISLTQEPSAILHIVIDMDVPFDLCRSDLSPLHETLIVNFRPLSVSSQQPDHLLGESIDAPITTNWFGHSHLSLQTPLSLVTMDQGLIQSIMDRHTYKVLVSNKR